jgi:hypothetical protein
VAVAQPVASKLQVFEIRADADRRGYEGLETRDPNGLLHTVPKHRRSRRWRVIRLAKHWETPRVAGRPLKNDDYPCLDLVVPAFSARAVDSLRYLLVANGEVLPLRTASGKFFAYNLTKVADVLDEKASGVQFHRDGFTARGITSWAFVPELVERLSIFRIPQQPFRPLVTGTFVSRVQESQLNGFVFDPLWTSSK